MVFKVMAKNKPNPGSQQAREQGCICAVLDNSHGRGVPWPRQDGKDPKQYPSFWITEGCPIHAPSSREALDAQG